MTDGPKTPRFLPDSVETFRQVLQVRELMSRRLAADSHAAPEVCAGWQDIHDKIDVPTLAAWGLDPLPDPHDTAGTSRAVNILGTPLDGGIDLPGHLEEVLGPTVKFITYSSLATYGPCNRPELHARVRRVRPEVSDSAIDTAVADLREEGKVGTAGNPGNYVYQTTSHQTGELSNGTG